MKWEEFEKRTRLHGAEICPVWGSKQMRVYCPACLNTIYYLPLAMRPGDDVPEDLFSEVLEAIEEHFSTFNCQ